MSSHDSRLLLVGRALFAAALAAWGVQYLLYGHFVRGLIPAQAWVPPLPLVAYAAGVVLVVAAVALFVPALAARAALAVGVLYLAGTIAVNLSHLGRVVRDGGTRTGALEPLAVAGAALVLAAVTRAGGAAVVGRIGRLLFAFALVVFGVQHFLYARFIASLILPWMPAHLPLVYLSGAGMVAAGLAIATGILARLAAVVVGLMFLSWVLLLHAPLVATHLHDGDHWSSLFVALAMAGASFIVGASFAE